MITGSNGEQRILQDNTNDFEVNVFGTLNVCRAFSDKIAKEGAIINVTSILALANLPVMGLYCASKSALHSATQVIACGIRFKRRGSL